MPRKAWKEPSSAWQRFKGREAKKQRAHELEMKLLDWLASDPDAKYYLGVAAGAGVAALSTMLESVLPPPPDPYAGMSEEERKRREFQEKKAKLDNAFAGWLVIAAGPAAVMAANPDFLNGLMGGDDSTPWGALNGAVKMAGISFAGFCASVLILRAIFGQEGAPKLTKMINDIIPG